MRPILLLLASGSALFAQETISARFVPSASSTCTFTHAQATGFTSTLPANNTINVVLTNNPASGDVVSVKILLEHGVAITSVADSNSNAYTATTSSPSNGNAGSSDAWIFYLAPAPANATKTITITWSGLKNIEAYADDFSVTGCTAAFSSDAVGNGSVNGNTNNPSITSAAGNLLDAGVAWGNGTATGAQSPWTANSHGSGNRTDAGYILNSSGSSTTVVFAVSFATAAYNTIVAAYH